MKTFAEMAMALFVGMLLFRLCETTHDEHMNGWMRGREFEHNHDLTHPYTGEKIKLKSSGKFRNVINLDKVQGVKSIRSLPQTLWLSFETSKDLETVHNTWREGEIITSRIHADLLSEGLKKIKKIDVVGKRKLKVIFTAASPYQVLEYADILHHHKPPDENHLANCIKEHRRLKRTTWWQKLKKWTEEKILDTFLPIEWNENRGISRNFNYNPLQNQAIGNFAVAISSSGGTTFDSMDNEYFERGTRSEDNARSRGWVHSSTMTVECDNCYMSFSAGVTFELKIQSDGLGNVVLKKFLLEFGTEAKLNYGVKVRGKYTNRGTTPRKIRLWKSDFPEKFLIAIPLAHGIQLDLNLDLELWFESSFNVDTDLSASFGFDSEARRIIKIEKQSDWPTNVNVSHVYTPFNPHPLVVDCQSCNTTGKLSFYPQLEVTAGLSLDIGVLDYSAFKVALAAPIDFWLKPDFEIKKIRWGSSGQYFANFTLDAGYKTHPMNLKLDILGRQWECDLMNLDRRGEITIAHRTITGRRHLTEDTEGTPENF